MFKVWSADRQQKKSVSASSIQELVRKGKTKFTAMYGTAVIQVIIGSVFMRGIDYFSNMSAMSRQCLVFTVI